MRQEQKAITCGLVSLCMAGLGLAIGSAHGGPLDAPAPPGGYTTYTLEDLYQRLLTGAPRSQSAFLEPLAGPASTGHTLNDLMGVTPALDDAQGASPDEVLTGRKYWGLTSGGWGTRTGAAAAGAHVAGANGALVIPIPDGLYRGARNATASDGNLLPENIKAGVTLFGVTGSAPLPTGNAAAGDVLAGRGFSNGSATGLTGSMPDRGAMTITPGTSSQQIPQGFHNGSGSVAGDASLVSGNIRAGTTVFGVTGDPNVVNTGSGDAAASDLRSGRKAWVDGAEVTGSAIVLSPYLHPIRIYLGTANNGNFGGRAGLDAACAPNKPAGAAWAIALVCDAELDVAGMQTTYAIPADRPVVAGSTVVAINWAQLMQDGVYDNLISAGIGSVPGDVYTGCMADGTTSPSHCAGWSSSGNVTFASVGRPSLLGTSWLHQGYSNCATVRPVYCAAW